MELLFKTRDTVVAETPARAATALSPRGCRVLREAEMGDSFQQGRLTAILSSNTGLHTKFRVALIRKSTSRGNKHQGGWRCENGIALARDLARTRKTPTKLDLAGRMNGVGGELRGRGIEKEEFFWSCTLTSQTASFILTKWLRSVSLLRLQSRTSRPGPARPRKESGLQINIQSAHSSTPAPCRGGRAAVPSRLHAFTLIELLVVISVIALLISILLPALKQAREAARQVGCAGNLHQVGVGMYAYLSDNSGVFPAVYLGGLASGETRATWPRLLSKSLDLGLESQATQYTSDLNPNSVLRCPSMPFESGFNFERHSFYGVTYGYNANALGGPNYDPYANYGKVNTYPKRIDTLSSAVEQMMHADVIYKTDFPGRGRLDITYVDWIGYRHNDHVNILYADGRVETKSMDALTLSGLSGYTLYNQYPWNWFGNQ